MIYAWMDGTFGPVLIARDEVGVRVVAFKEGKRTRAKPRRPEADWREDPAGLVDEIAQLEAYFAGELRCFSMPLAPHGTDFQRLVWGALQDIPYGQTISYGTLAERIGRPNAVRAVGAANGANPIGVVIPCHRVVGADGSLTGYGGGVEKKARLLAHEQRVAPGSPPHGQLGLAFE